jgi:hypothetical protein
MNEVDDRFNKMIARQKEIWGAENVDVNYENKTFSVITNADYKITLVSLNDLKAESLESKNGRRFEQLESTI